MVEEEPSAEEYHVPDGDVEAVVDEQDDAGSIDVQDDEDDAYPHLEDQEEDRA
ncbi:hypothetical protein [Nocardioides sp. Root190]|uniref:hypothetical protein n=1 Tax=Nocardioides sp. Root190 TaxID=1736488 RepID=UPI0012FC409F|nr:hypothetical protein [Nocardioides sp. Root190]